MNDLLNEKLKQLQSTYGPLYGCRLDFVSFEIGVDEGQLSLAGEAYSGYVVNYGTSSGPHLYTMIDPDAHGGASFGEVLADKGLPDEFHWIEWGSDDENWSSAHGRLMSRLRRMSWASFVGGESRLPPIGAPSAEYPGDGGQWIDEMLRPEPAHGDEDRDEEELLYMSDPKAWHAHVGTPCFASGWNAPSDSGKYHNVACFISPLETGKPWSIHDGDTQKIAHLYDDPARDQFLGSLDDALKVFDDFEGDEYITRAVLTRNRAKLIRLPKSELTNQVPRNRKSNKDEIVDSSSTRPPSGKGFGEGHREGRQ